MLWDGDDIEAGGNRKFADDGAEATFDEVADDGVAHAAAHGVADTAVGEVIGSGGEMNHRTASSLTVAHYRLEVSTTAQTLHAREGGWLPRRVHDGWSYTDSCARPRTRRRARMWRPFLVDMRARKPCFRFRGIRFGCQVRLGTGRSVQARPARLVAWTVQRRGVPGLMSIGAGRVGGQ